MAKKDDEKLEVEYHDQAEAEKADAEHHMVADPPSAPGSPVVPQGTRRDDEYGTASHVDRINPGQVAGIITDANGKQWLRDKDGNLAPLVGGPVHRVASFAAEDHPEDVRWPYVLTRQSFTTDHAIAPPGSIVWLLRHEVAAFHRLVDRAMFKDLGVPKK